MEHEILPYSCDYQLNLRGRTGDKAPKTFTRRWGVIAVALKRLNPAYFLLLSRSYFLGITNFTSQQLQGSVHSRCHWSCGKLLRTYAARLSARRSLQMFSPSKILL